MITIKTPTDLTGVSAGTILMGECFILSDEEAGDEVYMRIHDDVYNIHSSHICALNAISGESIIIQNKVICTQLETGWVFAFDKDEKVIPVSGIFRWRENDGIKS